jgi:hypothetical protein
MPHAIPSRLSATFVAASLFVILAGPLSAQGPELPPLVFPSSPGRGPSIEFEPTPDEPTPSNVQKVTPLDVTPVPTPSTIPGSTFPGSTIPSPGGPGSTIPGGIAPIVPLGPSPLMSPVPLGGSMATTSLPPGYGLHIVVGEDFANQFVATQRQDAGPIADRALGADIRGCQTTNTQTRMNFLPCERLIQGQLELSGDTRTQTTATTSQASIQSTGNAHFEVTKAIEFNGEVIATRSPAAYLTTAQRNRAAATQFTRVPLLGPLADSFALQQADQRRPEAERIAAYKITEQVAPQFNTQVDEQLVSLNQKLGDLRPRLQTLNLAPLSLLPRSTDQSMSLSLRMTPDEQVASSPVVTEQGLSIAVHESLVNGLIGRLGLGGMSVSDAQINGMVGNIRSMMGLPAAPQSEPGAVQATLVLARQNPVSARFQNGRIELVLVTAFQVEGAPPTAEKAITIPLRPSAGPNGYQLVPEKVEVIDSDGNSDAADQAANTIIGQTFQMRIPTIDIPTNSTIPLDGGRTLPIVVTSITADGGWLVVRLQGAAPPQVIPGDVAPIGPTLGPSPAPTLAPRPDLPQTQQPFPRRVGRGTGSRFRYRESMIQRP